MVGSAIASAPAAMCLGVFGTVAGPPSTAAQFSFNGARREAEADWPNDVTARRLLRFAVQYPVLEQVVTCTQRLPRGHAGVESRTLQPIVVIACWFAQERAGQHVCKVNTSPRLGVKPNVIACITNDAISFAVRFSFST